jgi:hypothetical protein
MKYFRRIGISILGGFGMKYVYVSELCVSIRFKKVDENTKVSVKELEELKSKAMEVVEKALEEAGFEFDGILGGPFQLILDWEV